MSRRFEVNDDSGLIALVDHHAYPTFVSNEWTYETLFGHFRTAMAKRSLLVWGTGREEPGSSTSRSTNLRHRTPSGA